MNDWERMGILVGALWLVPAAVLWRLLRINHRGTTLRAKLVMAGLMLTWSVCAVAGGTYAAWETTRRLHFADYLALSLWFLQAVLWTWLCRLIILKLRDEARSGRAMVKGQPTFFWQGLLITVPVAVVALFGGAAIVKTQKADENQVRLGAASLADSTRAIFEDYLQPAKSRVPGAVSVEARGTVLVVGPGNRLVSPRPVDWPPDPKPLPAGLDSGLSSRQLEQWNAAQTALARRDWSRAAQLYLDFLNAGIPDYRFRLIASFNRALACEQLGETNLAISAYNDVVGRFGDASLNSLVPRTESGLALIPLAALKIMDLAHDDPARLPDNWRRDPQGLITKLASQPSPFDDELHARLRAIGPELAGTSQVPVTPGSMFYFLDSADAARLRYAEVVSTLPGDTAPWPAMFWVNGEFPWLAVRQRLTPTPGPMSSNETWYVAFPESVFSNGLATIGRNGGGGQYTIRAEICGRPVGPRTDGEFAARAQSPDGLIMVSASLADAPAYFARLRREKTLFCGLLAAAILAANIGFFAARRAFFRQLRLNEMKSDFVSSVSHELRAPIASVRLMAEGLERGRIAEPDQQREYFKFIVQECRRLSSLIENVLDFSRIEQGRKQYELESTDLVALTQQTVKVMETYAAERSVGLALRIEGEPAPVNLDGKAMQQALVNLIDNAVKHSPKGGAVIVGLEFGKPADQPRSTVAQPGASTVCSSEFTRFGGGAASRPPEGGATNPEKCSHVRIWVEDHGDGIAASEHEKIFERFYRVGSELRRETQGVGIGLSIVKHVVEAHGGRVTVRSAPGQGSRFTIELPGNMNSYVANSNC